MMETEQIAELQKQNLWLEGEVERLSRQVKKLSDKLAVKNNKSKGNGYAKGSSVLGVLKKDRGELSENRIVSSIIRLSGDKKLPVDILSVRRSTKEEDRAGIDIVVETSEGTITLQAKSSKTGARNVRLRRIELGVGDIMPVVLIVSVDTAIETVDSRVLASIRHGLCILRKQNQEAADNDQT